MFCVSSVHVVRLRSSLVRLYDFNSKMFRESFKYYKSKKEEPNLEKVYDLYSKNPGISESEIRVRELNNNRTHFTLIPQEFWEVYEFSHKPGLIYIKNPFTSNGQRYWTIRCLRDYSKKSNKTNIDCLNLIPENKEWWDIAKNDNSILNKLRWATLGYHHNWDTKVYSESNKGEFPVDLTDLTKVIAHNLGYTEYTPEAAIINYYHMDSTLSGHTDHSEINLTAPLFSFSFGQTAVFLLGGKTIDEEPLAIFLKSGDIIIMSEDTRLCYHGVPRILKTLDKSWNSIYTGDNNSDKDATTRVCENDKLWKPFSDYLDNCRINMNVRQVLHSTQKSLDEL